LELLQSEEFISDECNKSSHNEKTKKLQPSQHQIDQIIYNNPECKQHKDQKFVKILIKDLQPISIQNNEGFREFIAEFDLSYKI
ncbi:5695_t:CDS:2, partial [Racocetra fulgida]